MRIARCLLPVLCLSLWSTSALAQRAPQPGPSVPSETAELARGWALLAQGDAAKAAALANELIKKNPRSIAIASFAVETEVSRRGSLAGLGAYERWLQTRTLEDGYLLRRIARALLFETIRNRQDPAGPAAIDALVADGEPRDAVEASDATPGSASASGAAKQDAAAVNELLAVLAQPMGNKASAIRALVRMRSQRAVKPLIGLLDDEDPATRAAAAQGLGELQAAEAVPGLQPLLNDPVFNVKLTAASALVALKDTTAVPWLRELQSSEHAGVRIAAARAMRTQPDAAWVELLRGLTKDSDPEVRREAAELIAPHDPETARAALEPLLNDANPAEREAATNSYLQYAVTDFAALRRFLRDTDSGARVRAAARVLELTR
jgi:HEAT repeat protein